MARGNFLQLLPLRSVAPRAAIDLVGERNHVARDAQRAHTFATLSALSANPDHRRPGRRGVHVGLAVLPAEPAGDPLPDRHSHPRMFSGTACTQRRPQSDCSALTAGAAKDIPPPERLSTEMTQRGSVGWPQIQGAAARLPRHEPAAGGHFQEGFRSPDQSAEFPSGDTAAVKLALRQNTTIGDEGFEIALRQDTAYYGHQFASLSDPSGWRRCSPRAAPCSTALGRCLRLRDRRGVPAYPRTRLYDVNRDAGGCCAAESEIAVPHYVPPEAIKQAWVGRWDGATGGSFRTVSPSPTRGTARAHARRTEPSRQSSVPGPLLRHR